MNNNNNNNIVLADIFFSFIQTIDDDHGQEKERLIDQGKYTVNAQQQQRRTISATDLSSTRADETTHDNRPLMDQNPTNDSDQPRRARSMLNETKCVPS